MRSNHKDLEEKTWGQYSEEMDVYDTEHTSSWGKQLLFVWTQPPSLQTSLFYFWPSHHQNEAPAVLSWCLQEFSVGTHFYRTRWRSAVSISELCFRFGMVWFWWEEEAVVLLDAVMILTLFEEMPTVRNVFRPSQTLDLKKSHWNIECHLKSEGVQKLNTVFE